LVSTRAVSNRLFLSDITRKLVVGWVIGLGLISLTAFAESQERRGRMTEDSRAERRADRRMERLAPPEQAMGGEVQREGNRLSSGLSSEERKQLRHDVRQAGRDLYPDHPRRRRE
jgi:hypothetical protein